MFRTSRLLCLLACTGCAGSAHLTIGSNGASAGAEGAAEGIVPAPPPGVAAHVNREIRANQAVRVALAACDQARSNEHLLPSEFFDGERRFNENLQAAMLGDVSLRSSNTLWRSPSGKSDTLDDWITNCDAWFKANHDVFAQAAPMEDAARAAATPKPAAAGPQPKTRNSPRDGEMTTRVVANEDALFEGEDTGALKSCVVQDGAPTKCTGPYSGTTVTQKDGMVRSCKVNKGKIESCGDAFEGKAVIKREGKVRECDIEAGQPLACSSEGYDGLAVVPVSSGSKVGR
jgi:hypothetical protein